MAVSQLSRLTWHKHKPISTTISGQRPVKPAMANFSQRTCAKSRARITRITSAGSICGSNVPWDKRQGPRPVHRCRKILKLQLILSLCPLSCPWLRDKKTGGRCTVTPDNPLVLHLKFTNLSFGRKCEQTSCSQTLLPSRWQENHL